jgi:hypothetical protein
MYLQTYVFIYVCIPYRVYMCSDVERVRAAIDTQYDTHSYQAERKMRADQDEVARPLDLVHLTKKYKVCVCECECSTYACALH